MAQQYKLGFIGAGNMAWAIADGVIRAGLYTGTEIITSDIAVDRCKLFADKLGAAVTNENSQVVKQADLIVLAIKPQQAKACWH